MATTSPIPTDYRSTAVTPTARSVRSQSGFTLVELLVTMMIFLALLAIVVPALTSILKAEPRVSERAHSVQRARATVERVVRELRVSYSVQTATASKITFLTYNRHATCGGGDLLTAEQPANNCRITVTCSGAAGDVICTRSEQPVVGTGNGSSAELVKGISSPNVFSYVPDASSPDQVRIRLEFPGTAGDDAVTLEDAADLRNVTPGV